MTSSNQPTPATFIGQAQEFLNAAHEIKGKNMRRTHLLLICQGLELVFKAYCLHNGISLKKLKDKFGHNLVKLFDQAQSLGLGLNTNAQSAIAFMNDDYLSRALHYVENRPYYASKEENLEAGLATVIIEVKKRI